MNAAVLIVEDEMLVALQLEDIVSDAGHHVVGVVADRSSLGTMTDAPQVALVDLNLRDGATGCRIARDLSRTFGTKIIYVTANPAQIEEPAPTAVGVIEKPFSPAAILTAIHLALGGGGGETGNGPRGIAAVGQIAPAPGTGWHR